MLADALLPLPRYPMSGVVSPPLLATSGIVPFSVFSTGPDIIQHYYDCIVAAQKEVVLLTNYWQLGKNVDRISEGLRELNKRHAKRKTGSSEVSSSEDSEPKEKSEGGSTEKVAPNKRIATSDQIIVKIMWDRGPQTLADLFRSRKPVPPPMWKKSGLPKAKEVPYLNIEILNYHRPLMGTFHAKLLLVDRQVALINSNNIQDRPNIEACTRLEGDIVNSVYDHALISWGNRLRPPLPCLAEPASKTPPASSFSSSDESSLPHMTASKLREIALTSRKRLQDDNEESEGKSDREGKRKSFADVVETVMRREGPSHTVSAQNNETANNEKPPQTENFHSERDRAAHRAGAEWARKVLGERFHPSAGLQHQANQNNSGSGAITPERKTGAGQSPGGSPRLSRHAMGGGEDHERRHFSDVVHSLMEKEGIKPALWAEGALDAFGLGPSSSRNVATDLRRSRIAAKSAAAKHLNVPHAVEEEGGTGDANGADDTVQGHGDTTETPTLVNQRSSLEMDKVPPQETSEKADGLQSKAFPSKPEENGHALETSHTSPSLSTTNLESSRHQDDETKDLNNQPADVDATKSASKIPSGEFDRREDAAQGESAPGSHAYQQRHRRTISTRSKASASERLAAITKSLDFANLSQVRGEITAQQLASLSSQPTPNGDQNAFEVLEFNPFIFHLPHGPVPMALVNRRPHGTPGHSDIRNAQDAAWLAGFRYARRHIFIQSPTLNATPIKHAVLHAARRHVRVELWLGLGFNDKSESMPFQGGTNEQVVTRLYRQLRREGKGDEKYLEVYWYTGKDMTRPLNAVRKQRNCHVKYAQFDDQVAIIGSGNQDTQSWYHSQEINVMVDSAQIVAEWNKGLRRNQSTQLYGKVDLDGIWRGQTGSETVDKGDK